MASSNEQTGVTPEQIRNMALALPEATESPHFERISFRVNNKIFATLAADKDECVVKLSLADQSACLTGDTNVFFEVGWAHQGWTGISINRIHCDVLEGLLESAWKNVAPKKMLAQLSENKSS